MQCLAFESREGRGFEQLRWQSQDVVHEGGEGGREPSRRCTWFSPAEGLQTWWRQACCRVGGQPEELEVRQSRGGTHNDVPRVLPEHGVHVVKSQDWDDENQVDLDDPKNVQALLTELDDSNIEPIDEEVAVEVLATWKDTRQAMNQE